MLYKEIMAVCSEIHTKHMNTVCGKNVDFQFKHELYLKTQSIPRCKHFSLTLYRQALTALFKDPVRTAL